MVFSSTPPTSSTPTPAPVVFSSVVSGRIALAEPTRWVVPTPNPPTTTILTARDSEAGSASSSAGPASSSELGKAIQHRLQQFGVRKIRGDDRGARLGQP